MSHYHLSFANDNVDFESFRTEINDLFEMCGCFGTEMERFPATQDYKDKRKALFGEEYTQEAGDINAETMCYEHNETSSIIGAQLLIDFARKNGYSIEPNSEKNGSFLSK